jgi:GH15 family glucan-1,4-alpha-glucosidase
VSSWNRPCYDWWEEYAEHVHVSTLGCIAAGLDAAGPILDDTRAEAAAHTVAAIRERVAADGTTEGRLTKWLGSDRLDASLLALVSPMRFEPATGAVGAATTAAIAAELDVDGGVHRYTADTYFGGGQWPLLTCMLGLARADAGDRDGALESLQWAVSTATQAGELPEQVNWHLLHPEHEQEWIERWGPSAVPLLWTHAMVLRLAVELGVVEPGQGAA